jgi:DNA-binding transcriptional ArsR family regulator
MPEEPQDGDRIVLTDPRAIRALAHPARLALIEALTPGEELTATEAAAVTGLSPSATSYHLKALAKWGIVEPGEARTDGRDRPWKARGRSIEVSSPAPDGTALAELAILTTFLDRNRAIAAEFLENQAGEPEAWRDTVEAASSDYWLTVAEVRQVARAMRAILEPYQDRRKAVRPAGSRRVRIARLIVPRALSTLSADAGTTARPDG